MRLKSVVLDGFKSYAHRQEMGDLDPHFNAITGLNGSGKSNIFDALCFVMGISSLKKVRAEEPRDLIYKSGNAGIQKAQVTIEFINDDVHTAPAGYHPDHYPVIRIGRQVQVGGKQKFFLNDRVSDQTKVKNFFQNALLNVDNAHFMVLQGTVHKMIGMKSHEILGLLEEASGTRVFDTRRRTAENLLRSKEKRVEAINESIDELTPRIEAMHAQQEEYSMFLRARDSFAEKNRFAIAHHYYVFTKAAEIKRQKALDELKVIEDCKKQLSDLPGEKTNTQERISMLEVQKQAPSEAIERLHNMEHEARKEHSKIREILENSAKSLRSMERDMKRITADKAKIDQDLANFQDKYGIIQDEYTSKEQQLKMTKDRVEKLKESLRLQKSGVKAGMNGMSMEEEKANIKKKLLELEGSRRRLIDKYQGVDRDTKRALTAYENTANSMAEANIAIQRTSDEFTKAEYNFEPYRADFDNFHKNRSRLAELRAQLQKKTSDVFAGSNIPPFQYDDVPGYNFSKSIYGRVGELLIVQNEKYSKALTVGAGVINLVKIVITDDKKAQQMIEKANLRSRTSFFPLNTINATNVIDNARLSAAKEKASKKKGDFVELGSTFLTFDPKYKEIANLLFGTFVICSNLELAQELASDPKTKMKAVTVDGDVADPQGLVTGGSNAEIRDLMAEFKVMAGRNAPIDAIKDEIAKLEAVQQTLEQRCQQGELLRTELIRAEEAMHNAKQAMSLSDGGAAQQLEDLKKIKKGLDEELAQNQEEQEKLRNRVTEIDKLLKADPDNVEKEIAAKLKAEEHEVIKLIKQLEEGSHHYDTMEAEKVNLEQSSLDIMAQLDTKTNDIIEKKKEREGHVATQEVVVNKLASIDENLKIEQSKADVLCREYKELTEALKKLESDEDTLSKRARDAEARIKILHREADTDKSKSDQLLRDHQWIQAECHSFGDVNGPYFFDDEVRTKDALNEVEKLRTIISRSERSVNEKASMMYDEHKADLNTLISRKQTLSMDRDIILQTITAVEKRKWGALDKMFNEVSKLFGSLFATCLPNASARLVEERDNEVNRLTGLQVKVSFNGREKESLTELSGGQRSLLALCLILAILRVRPAPVYVLDEVDAALDPSHTQNLGQMLQTHFPSSQFLLVSLKDGMFNNANVLYEIRNTQGYSEITRRAAARRR